MSGLLAEKETDGNPRQDMAVSEDSAQLLRGCLLFILSVGPERIMRS